MKRLSPETADHGCLLPLNQRADPAVPQRHILRRILPQRPTASGEQTDQFCTLLGRFCKARFIACRQFCLEYDIAHAPPVAVSHSRKGDRPWRLHAHGDGPFVRNPNSRRRAPFLDQGCGGALSFHLACISSISFISSMSCCNCSPLAPAYVHKANAYKVAFVNLLNYAAQAEWLPGRTNSVSTGV